MTLALSEAIDRPPLPRCRMQAAVLVFGDAKGRFRPASPCGAARGAALHPVRQARAARARGEEARPPRETARCTPFQLLKMRSCTAARSRRTCHTARRPSGLTATRERIDLQRQFHLKCCAWVAPVLTTAPCAR